MSANGSTAMIHLPPSLSDTLGSKIVLGCVANAAATSVARRAKIEPIKSASECTSPHEQRSQLRAFQKLPEVGG